MLELPNNLGAWLATATVLGLLPFALAVTTAYAKIVIVLNTLRRALGFEQAPPNSVVTALAILLTAFVMAPIGAEMLAAAAPVLSAPPSPQTAPLELAQALQPAAEPLLGWLGRHSGEGERTLLVELARQLYPPEHAALGAADFPLITVGAFVLTELREAFVAAFLIMVPFLVIDLVVAAVLASTGLSSLSTQTVSLPFKLLLFVLIDGWALLVQGLVLGYG